MKSFFSKLGVLLLGATFAVVGCTDFAEDIREVSDKVDKNMADVTVSTDALDDAIEDLKAQQAADKTAAETALAGLKTTLEGKIQTDIAAAEARLTAAYEAADQVVTTGYTNADAALKADLIEKINEAKKAAEDANKTLEDALEAADKAIEEAYKAEDVKINAAIAALESKLTTEVTRIEGLVNTVDAKFKGFEEAYKNADIILDGKIADLSAELKKMDEAYKIADANIDAAYKAADTAINKRIDDVEKLIADLQKADEDLQAAIDANKKTAEDAIKAEADARVEAINGLTQIHNNDKKDLLEAIKVNSEAISAEIKAREDADKNLQANIDAANDALAQAKKDLEDADKELDAAIKANDKDIEALQNRATALEARVDDLESWKTTAQQDIDKNKADIAKLAGDLKLLETAYQTADKLLQDNIDKVNASLDAFKTQVDETYAKKTDLDAAKTELKGLVTALEEKVNAQRTELEKMITDLDEKLSELIAANDAAIKAEVNAREEAVKAVEEALAKAKKELEGADKSNKEELEGKITALQTELEQKIADQKAALEEAIKEEETARANAINEVNKLIDAVKADVEELKKADSALASRLDELESWKTSAIEVLAKISGIEADLGDLKERVDSLFNQIQSVVYKPTHADGKARIQYATIGSACLEGNSTIVYKVYPQKHTKTIVDAYNKGLLTLTYDLESVVKSSTPSLTVVSVADKTTKADLKEGELEVTVKAANLGAFTFYNNPDNTQPRPTLSYSAALVLNYGKNGVENFSTEYTNLVSAEASTTYTFGLYVGNTPYTEVEAQEIEWLAIDPAFWTKTVLNGLNVKFSDGTKTYSEDEFFAIYPLAKNMYTPLASNITGDTEIFYAAANEFGYVEAYLLKDEVAEDNVNKSLNVKYEATFNGQTESATGTVTVVPFGYTMEVSAAPTEVLLLPYTDTKVVPVNPDFEITFAPDSKTEAELVAEGYYINVDTLDVVKNITTAVGDATMDLFEVAETVEGENAPVNVKLAQDNGVNKALAANVGTILNVSYGFQLKDGKGVAIGAQIDRAQDVKIEKTMYSYDIAVSEIEWTYSLDAEADKDAINNSVPAYCSRNFEFGYNENSSLVAISDAYRTGSETKEAMTVGLTIEDVLATATLKEIKVGNDTYVNGVDSPITFTDSTPDDDKINVSYNKLAWDGSYSAVATYEMSSAIVNINLTASTKDRNRDAIEIDLGEVRKTYAVNFTSGSNKGFVLEPSADTEVSLGLKDRLVVNKNLGAVESVDDALLAQVLAKATATYFETRADDAHKYTSTDTGIKTGLRFKDATDVNDFSLVTYGFHYGNLTNTSIGYVNGDTIAKDYYYSASFKTWYGQEVNVKLAFCFDDPTYNYAPVYQYVLSDENGYYVNVQPSYKNGGNDVTVNANPIDYFDVKSVDLNKAFVVEGENISSDTYESDLATLSLVRKFEIVGGPYDGITCTDNKINYNGSAPYVPVYASLSLENSYNGVQTYYRLENTIFDGAYANTQVRKYDPIQDLEVKADATTELVVTENVEYKVNVLSNFSLLDKRGHQLIDYNSESNAFVTGDNTNGFATGSTADNVYNIEAPKYEISVVEPLGVSVQGISIDNTNGVITVDNTGQLVYEKPVTLKVKVTIKYPQTEGKSAEFQIKIKKPDTL